MDTIQIKELTTKLNKEYEKIGSIHINSATKEIVDISKIKYVQSIMDKIDPLENSDPIVLSKKYYTEHYTLIDGYHRLKFLKENNDTVNAIVLTGFNIDRKYDCLFDFISQQKKETICFTSDHTFTLSGKEYCIEENEGCGGCGNGWSTFDLCSEAIHKQITIKTVENKNQEGDSYDLFINGEKIAHINTGWGNGYYGGDFSISLYNNK